MIKELVATYYTNSIWDIDEIQEEYGFDLESVYDWGIKWNELVVIVHEGDEPITIEPNVVSAEDMHDYIKSPSELTLGSDDSLQVIDL